MNEYAITVEFWVQTEDERDEAKTKFAEVLSERNLNLANVSGWDIVNVEDVG